MTFFFKYYTSKKDDRFTRGSTELKNLHRKTKCNIYIKYEKCGKKKKSESDACWVRGQRAQGVNYNEGE